MPNIKEISTPYLSSTLNANVLNNELNNNLSISKNECLNNIKSIRNKCLNLSNNITNKHNL